MDGCFSLLLVGGFGGEFCWGLVVWWFGLVVFFWVCCFSVLLLCLLKCGVWGSLLVCWMLGN